MQNEINKLSDKLAKNMKTASLSTMNDRLRKELEKAFKVIKKLEEWLRKEWVHLDKEKNNENLVWMMKEIEEEIEWAKQEDLKWKG